MTELTDYQKKVYNCFLKHSRNGLPYKPRIDFSDLSENYVTDLLKVSSFLEKYPNIKWDEYFGAPRLLHPDEKCPNLGFFYTRSAIKSYNLLKKKEEMQNPKKQLKDIKRGFKFIAKFCIANNIKFEDYINHYTGLVPSWVLHHKKREINIYCLMGYSDVLKHLSKMEQDEKEIYEVENLYELIGNAKMTYVNSKDIHPILSLTIKKLSIYVKKSLQ